MNTLKDVIRKDMKYVTEEILEEYIKNAKDQDFLWMGIAEVTYDSILDCSLAIVAGNEYNVVGFIATIYTSHLKNDISNKLNTVINKNVITKYEFSPIPIGIYKFSIKEDTVHIFQ